MLQFVIRSLTKSRHRAVGKTLGNISFCQYHSPLSSQDRKNPAVVFGGVDELKNDPKYALAFAEVLRELTKDENCQYLEECKQRITKIINYAMPYGRQFEGRSVVDTYKLIESPEKLSDKSIKLAYVMSLCYSLQLTNLIIQDDIMEGRKMRKCVPCWYNLPNTGFIAINDAVMLQEAAFEILQKYFSEYLFYLPTLELFHTATYRFALGQAIDKMSTFDGKPRFEIFTQETIEYLIEYRITSFCYELPLKLALYLAGIYDTKLNEDISHIALKIGKLFSMHLALLDAFGKFEATGKESTDIRNGRVTWLAVEALRRGTSDQKQVFMKYYGSFAPESEQIICSLYKDLQLPKLYEEIEKQTIKSIYQDANNVSYWIPKQVFDNLLSDVTLYREGIFYN